MHGCSTALISSPQGSPEMAKLNRSRSWKPRPTFAIEWKGSYRINGPVFVYSDQDTGRAITILGYPTDRLVGE
jgi:hypothetical protein